MEIKLNDYIKKGEIVAFVPSSINLSKLKNSKKVCYIRDDFFSANISVKNYFKRKFKGMNEEKIQDAFRMVQLDLAVMDFNMSKLSKTETKLIRFVEALLFQSNVLVFENFSNGFYKKSKDYYQKLLLKLIHYGKSILFLTNDIEFLFGIVKSYYLFLPNGEIKLIDDFYKEEAYSFVSMPPIIHYVKYLQSKNIKMASYLDSKELLKAIYRDVSSKRIL